ncbi:MAG: SDR family oxidoreductase [Bacillota bacterium]
MDISVDLKDKVAVVTGGAGVLCSCLSKALAAQGAKTAVLDLRKDEAEKVADEINLSGGKAVGLEADVLNKESVEKAKEIVVKEFGTVDILINGAGGNSPLATTGPGQSFFDLTPEGIQKVFNLNFLGSVLPTQVFGKIMAEKKKGVVINISSMAAYTPLTRTIAYSAAKAAVTNFTRWMAVHFNQEYSREIRVNAIAPGFLLTKQNEYLLIDEKTGGPTKRGQSILNMTPMGRYGLPEDLIGAVLFLCSESASFVNGAVIPIDGGFLAYSGV